MANENRAKRYVACLLLLLIPAAIGIYALTRPNAAEDATNAIDASSAVLGDLGPGGHDTGGDQGPVDWRAYSGGDDDDDDENDGGSPTNPPPLSLSDAQVILSNVDILAHLPPDATNADLARDTTVQSLVTAAQRVAKQQGLERFEAIASRFDVAALSDSEQREIARVAEAQIAEVATRFEAAALDQAIEKLIRAVSELRVIHANLRSLLPKGVEIPKDALSLAPPQRLANALEGLRVQRRLLATKFAVLGGTPQSEAMLAHVDGGLSEYSWPSNLPSTRAFIKTRTDC